MMTQEEAIERIGKLLAMKEARPFDKLGQGGRASLGTD